MDRITATQEIKSRWRELYQADRHKGIVCPICGSGSGKSGTGISCDPGSRNYFLKCWNAGCSFNAGGSVIDLYMMEQGMQQDQFSKAVDDLARLLGIVIDPYTAAGNLEWDDVISDDGYAPARQTQAAQAAQPAQPARQAQTAQPVQQTQQVQPAQQTQADYSGYYRESIERLQRSPSAQSYLIGRGISLENAAAHGIGFDPEADPASYPGAAAGSYKAHPVPRLIIPTSASHYVGRSIDPNTDKAFQKLNSKGGKPGIFNVNALQAAEPVFVTEGAFDALSIIEAGAAAIALNSADNVENLLKRLQGQPTGATLLLALDNDTAGKTAQAKLQDGLNRLNIPNAIVNVCGDHKDANEYLTADRNAFIEAVKTAQARQALRPDNTADYIDLFMSGEIDRFKESGDKRTGFENIDSQAGGLYSGLYVLAAISSLGKTTLALQIADQIAASGHEVIFFSMEQSRLEMVSKSISRYTAQMDMQTAVNSLAIRRGYLPLQVLTAADKYKEAVGNRLSIVEGNFNCTVGYIGDYIRSYIARTGARPTVIIDYLQILQPAQDGKSRGSKKDEIDLAITELKRISREFDITVIIISSVNRANYQTEFSFESLKESGGIEYTADVVWGLQLACLDEPVFDKDSKIQEKRRRIAEAKAESPRKIDFLCIKNRYGISNYSCRFDYYPQYDLFVAAEPAKKRANNRF